MIDSQAKTEAVSLTENGRMNRGEFSEFSLPKETRNFALSIRSNLLSHCLQSLNTCEQDFLNARKKSDSSHAQAEQKVQQELKKAQQDYNEAETFVAKGHATLCAIYRRAAAHVSKLSKGNIPEPDWFTLKNCATPNSNPTCEAPEANFYQTKASNTCSSLLEIGIPRNVFHAPNRTLIFLGIAIFTASIFAYAIKNPWAVLIVSIPTYALCIWTWRSVKLVESAKLFRAINEAAEKSASCLREYAANSVSAKLKIEAECKLALEQTRQRHASEIASMEKNHAVVHEATIRRCYALAADFQKQFHDLERRIRFAGCDWTSSDWQTWQPDSSPEFAARIGTMNCFSERLQQLLPEANWSFRLPALVPFSEGRCLLLNANGRTKDIGASALQAVVIRALANTPPGKARFTLIDPVGLGHNVADLLPLGDFHSELVNGKAWTEPHHIEQQLVRLTEDMEKVIQTYLRKQYASLQEYNAEHPELTEPYRFLVIFDFPANFTESAARRLTSIVKNGPRCGIFTFVLRDTGKALPYNYDVEDLEDNAFILQTRDNAENFAWPKPEFEGFKFELDSLPPQEISHSIVQKSGSLAAQGMRRVVSFEKILSETQIPNSWRASSTSEALRVAIGPAGKGKPQELLLGSGQDAHALLVGRTGSGKTNLMHVIITGLALKYSPTELQLYLIDFKGGVGFKRYAESKLPHAKVIAIESEREFGLSVLRGLDAELKRRSDQFRASNVDNLSAYRTKTIADSPLPRILLIVDEFQELFVENDDLAQQSKIIFDRLARQGRSFGIHFLLATQSLAGPAQLPASIMGQVKVRIALACTEADSRMILADDNKAARSLSQPGEAIYNPMGGLIEGNNPFQVALFSEDHDLHKYLGQIGGMAREHACSLTPIVFEGNQLARTEDCEPLNGLLNETEWRDVKGVNLFLGEPIAIQPPVAARLRRQSGSNLLIVTREENEGVGICIASLTSILAQHRPETARIYVIDFTTPDSEWAEHAEEIAASFPGEISVLGRQRDIGSMLKTIAGEVHARSENPERRGSIFILFQGLHRIKALRENEEDDDGINAVELLQRILRDGPELGIHTIAWADTLPNVTRGLGRKVLAEFGLRVGAVMSSEDSMNLLDSLAASKISKPHRALFVDEDRPGQLVPFRPYAMPSVSWLKEVGQKLRARILPPVS